MVEISPLFKSNKKIDFQACSDVTKNSSKLNYHLFYQTSFAK